MSTQVIRIGAATVELSTKTATNVPDLTGVGPTVSAVDAADMDVLINDAKAPLPAGDYKVLVALVGRDETNGGYTIGASTDVMGMAQTITAGQGLLVKIASGDWPSDFDSAICAAIFLNTGASSMYTLAEFAYIDIDTDFRHMVISKPMTAAPKFAEALLTGSDPNDILGDRSPLGVSYAAITPTSGGVTVTRDVTTVTVAPDNSPDYQIASSRGANITFNSLSNDVKEVVRSTGGDYVKFTDTDDFEQNAMSMATAVARLSGNASIRLTMPPDNKGLSETRLYLGNLNVTQAQVAEAWVKTAPTLITFNLQTAIQDKMINNQHCEIQYKRIPA